MNQFYILGFALGNWFRVNIIGGNESILHFGLCTREQVHGLYNSGE